uniref:Acid phosphatase n=1 Tax=Aplanochytrium stocchinoi TaxID=215587 RepID=A0A7S3PFY8_9STRA|mmetsp:Transcript_6705/g.8178  ORF Transcript_6705/g.8178 Transcript_6705/m.8178 type:complete len:454 (+) Transcript_6705:60-1421(+)|eukprot:CAMPEP_0204861300 /NCGR_PEP_ID=MMETSP1348-20121228/1439_1 /ASSEMBLY_ACC=CAM_ASM_000700 /TAXON_ID=215587 /ORGANISM="Aplanochytrium stocchinoi, Strain GSBS06" /LENGTH=453 /DNA_ID=CAMNT_0052010597 /DNA_START=169 /DNA_END=1530 /DNA_ORIENTATION=+
MFRFFRGNPAFSRALTVATGTSIAGGLTYTFQHDTGCESEDGLGKQSRLVNAHVIFRHGARTPVFPCPGLEHLQWDKCKHVNRPTGMGGGPAIGLGDVHFKQLHVVHLDEGLPKPYSYVDDRAVRFNWLPGGTCRVGQLTDLGSKQASELGKALRERYGDLIEHNSANVYARSTNVARCLATLSAVLGSLLPDNVHDVIKVDTLRNHEEYLTPNTRICEKMSHIIRTGREEWLTDPGKQVKQLIEEMKAKLTKEQFESLDLPSNNLVRLRDWIVAIEAHEIKLPWEMSKEQIEAVDDLAVQQVSRYVGFRRDEKVSKAGMRLSIGRYVSEVLKEMRRAKEGMLYLTSAHDTTLVPLLITLDLFEEKQKWPGFCSDVAIELWEDLSVAEPNEMITSGGSDNCYFVRILYNGEEKCKLLLTEFEELLEDRTPSSWKDECKVGHDVKILAESGSHF